MTSEVFYSVNDSMILLKFLTLLTIENKKKIMNLDIEDKGVLPLGKHQSAICVLKRVHYQACF